MSVDREQANGEAAGLACAHEAAVETLNGSLKIVQRALRRLKRGRRGHRQGESIHQLRVACRRSEAGLWVFKGNLKGKRRRAIGRSLRQVRRAAGGVRACDVLDRTLAGVFQSPKGERLAALEWAKGEVDDRRQAALRQLRRKLNKISWKSVRKKRRKVIRSVRKVRTLQGRSETHAPNQWPAGQNGAAANEPILIDLARELLPAMVDRLMSMGGEDLRDPLVLHQMRLHSKRLRYSLEILGPCLPGELMKRVQPAVEALTGRLGSINDTFEACELVRGCSTDAQRIMQTGRRKKRARAARVWPRLREMAEALDARLRAQREDFLQWWRSTLADDVLGVIEREASALTPVSALRAQPVLQEQAV